MILSFVAAGLALLGVTCAQVWRNGGTVVGADFEAMLSLTNTAGLDQMIADLLSDTVYGRRETPCKNAGPFYRHGAVLRLTQLL